MKKVVEFDSIVAGLLLIFDKFDMTDLNLVIKDLKRKNNNIYIEDGFVNVSKFVEIDDDVITLKEGITLDSYIENTGLKSILEEIAGEEIVNYCNNLDIEGLTLEKISTLDSLPVDKLKTCFNSKQLDVIDKLLKNNHLITRWNEDVIYDDYQEITLTFLGKKQLYMYEYKDEVENFKEQLRTMRYDDALVDDFLKTQDLKQTPGELLTLDNFIDYGYSYDRNPLQEGARPIVYSNRDFINQKFKYMISIWERGHSIYVCHPNNIFHPEILTKEVKEIKNINWDKFDILKMLSNEDYKEFTNENDDSIEASVRDYLMYCLLNAFYNQEQNFVNYLAVVECYKHDGENNYLLRGIIKNDKEGLSFAFNPEYEKYLPQSIEEENRRTKGYSSPKIYSKKR